jgi:hypothetical protein
MWTDVCEVSVDLDYDKERLCEPFVSAWVGTDEQPAVVCGRIVSEPVVMDTQAVADPCNLWDPAGLDLFPGCEGLLDNQELQQALSDVALMMTDEVLEEEEEDEDGDEEGVGGEAGPASCVFTPNFMGPIGVPSGKVFRCRRGRLRVVCSIAAAVCWHGSCA